MVYSSAPFLAPALDALCRWYQVNARDLPWRRTKDPYRIWISEIMLQQTRVEAVISYYERFLKTLPTVQALASVPEDNLNRLWEGLGYYSRAKNLKKAAMEVTEKLGGTFPSEEESLLALPGIGTYTAAAIAAIAFGRPCAAVDGNVLRVFQRLRADDADILKDSTKREVKKILESAFGELSLDAGTVNQAFMDLGSAVCTPKNPRCSDCPLSRWCEAYARNLCAVLPVRTPKAKRKIQERTLFFITDGSRLLLHRRPEKGLLAGLYEPPGEEKYCSAKDVEAYFTARGISPEILRREPDGKHIFSHVEWHMQAWLCTLLPSELDQCILLEGEALYTDAQMASLAIPSAFDVWRKIFGRET